MNRQKWAKLKINMTSLLVSAGIQDQTLQEIFETILKIKKYNVFMDVEDLRAGQFNTRLYEVIENCKDFILVLSEIGVWYVTFSFDLDGLVIAHAHFAVGCASGGDDNTSSGGSQTPSTSLTLEAENGSGAGTIMQRSNASGKRTRLLKDGQSVNLAVSNAASGTYTITVRYSNDNFGKLETVTVAIEGVRVGSFKAMDTGDGGKGCNVFVSNTINNVALSAGDHTVTKTVTGGDGFGVEIDVIYLNS